MKDTSHFVRLFTNNNWDYFDCKKSDWDASTSKIALGVIESIRDIILGDHDRLFVVERLTINVYCLM